MKSPACCGQLMSLQGESEAGQEFFCSLCGRTKFVGKPKGPSAAPIPPKLARKALSRGMGKVNGFGTWLKG